MSVHRLYPTPYAERVDLIGDADVPRCSAGTTPKVRDSVLGLRASVCQFWIDEQEPDGVFVKLVAPRLTNHTVTVAETGVTVRASILCSDCGVHGFVTNSRWAAA
jgi:hypothetical protein